MQIEDDLDNRAEFVSIMQDLETNREHQLLSATSRICPYLIVSDRICSRTNRIRSRVMHHNKSQHIVGDRITCFRVPCPIFDAITAIAVHE